MITRTKLFFILSLISLNCFSQSSEDCFKFIIKNNTTNFIELPYEVENDKRVIILNYKFNRDTLLITSSKKIDTMIVKGSLVSYSEGIIVKPKKKIITTICFNNLVLDNQIVKIKFENKNYIFKRINKKKKVYKLVMYQIGIT